MTPNSDCLWKEAQVARRKCWPEEIIAKLREAKIPFGARDEGSRGGQGDPSDLLGPLLEQSPICCDPHPRTRCRHDAGIDASKRLGEDERAGIQILWGRDRNGGLEPGGLNVSAYPATAAEEGGWLPKPQERR